MSMLDSIRQDMKKVHLAYAPTEADADAMIRILAEKGITAYKGSGIRDVYAIGDPVGIEIFVGEEDAVRSAEILRQMPGSPAEPGKKAPGGRKALSWTVVIAALIAVTFLVRTMVLHA